MVDASNILRFEGNGAQSLDSQYSVEWWIFKPKNSGQQVIFQIKHGNENPKKQAGAELCQAQFQLKLKLVLGLD